MVDTNDKFLDVDFTKDERYVAGYSPKDPTRLCAGSYEDSFELVPESQWREISEDMERTNSGLEWLVNWILNQKSEGSCVGNAGTQGHMVCQAKEIGVDRTIQMSAISLYKQIGSSPNSGAMVSDAVDRLRDTGLLPLDTQENRTKFGDCVMPATGFYTRWPNDWKATAAKFSGVEGYACTSVNEMMSALLTGKPVIVGRSGHSILYLRPRYKSGDLRVLYVNSWNDDWGFQAGRMPGGFGEDSSRLFRESADWCYAFCAVDPSKWDW